MLAICMLVIILVPKLMTAQLFDMSDGSEEDLIWPCDHLLAAGNWSFVNASTYPGGPTRGSVLASDAFAASCLQTQVVNITSKSTFRMMVYVPYSEHFEEVKVMLEVDDENNIQIPWLILGGPVPNQYMWMEASTIIPQSIPEGNYKLLILDTSTNQSIAIRYFEIYEDQWTTRVSTTTSTTTAEPHVEAKGVNFALGLAGGAVLMSFIFCCWGMLFIAWKRQQKPKINSNDKWPILPRLQVYKDSETNSSCISLRGKAMESSDSSSQSVFSYTDKLSVRNWILKS